MRVPEFDMFDYLAMACAAAVGCIINGAAVAVDARPFLHPRPGVWITAVVLGVAAVLALKVMKELE